MSVSNGWHNHINTHSNNTHHITSHQQHNQQNWIYPFVWYLFPIFFLTIMQCNNTQKKIYSLDMLMVCIKNIHILKEKKNKIRYKSIEKENPFIHGKIEKFLLCFLFRMNCWMRQKKKASELVCVNMVSWVHFTHTQIDIILCSLLRNCMTQRMRARTGDEKLCASTVLMRQSEIESLSSGINFCVFVFHFPLRSYLSFFFVCCFRFYSPFWCVFFCKIP